MNYILGKKGPSGFGSKSTSYEVASTFKNEAKDKVILITGANSGIGFDTAAALATEGAIVVLACRNTDAMHNAADKIRHKAPKSTIHEIVCDLGSMESVRKCAEDFNTLNLPLNILINNAGVMGCQFSLTKDGFEAQFGTNHLGHFLLTNLLMPKLKEGAPSRIVNVASTAHRRAPPQGILWDFLKSSEKYDRLVYYGQSKLANMLHANELNRRLQENGITAASVHPGVISTSITRHSFLYKAVFTAGKLIMKSEPQGAATSVFCALAKPDSAGFEPGAYHADCNIGATNHAAYTPEVAQKLWDFSVEATGSDI